MVGLPRRAFASRGGVTQPGLRLKGRFCFVGSSFSVGGLVRDELRVCPVGPSPQGAGTHPGLRLKGRFYFAESSLSVGGLVRDELRGCVGSVLQY